MKRLFLIMTLAYAAAAPARAADPAPDPEARYQALVADAKAGQPVDWQALRFAYADRPSFDGVEDELRPITQKMMEARRADDFPAVLAQAKLVIDKDYCDGLAHMMASTAYHVLKQEADADREREIAVAIFKSIQTGDGLKPATAFTVISVREEYELMYARQRRVEQQSLVNEGGHAYDRLETAGRDGDKIAFYFLVDRVMAEEAKALGLKR